MISLRDMGVEEVWSQHGHRRRRNERSVTSASAEEWTVGTRVLGAVADVENKRLDLKSQTSIATGEAGGRGLYQPGQHRGHGPRGDRSDRAAAGRSGAKTDAVSQAEPQNWLSDWGGVQGRRYSSLSQIDPDATKTGLSQIPRHQEFGTQECVRHGLVLTNGGCSRHQRRLEARIWCPCPETESWKPSPLVDGVMYTRSPRGPERGPPTVGALALCLSLRNGVSRVPAGHADMGTLEPLLHFGVTETVLRHL